MFKSATQLFTCQVRTVFYFKYPNNAVSIHADTIILSGLMPCLSDHPQQTTLPPLIPFPRPPRHPPLSPGDLSRYCHTPAWVIPQCVRAGDTEPAPPGCVL